MGIPLENVEVILSYKVNLTNRAAPSAYGNAPLDMDNVRKLRIAKILREVRLFGPLDEEQRAVLMEEAACCPVSNTLSQTTRIEDVAVR